MSNIKHLFSSEDVIENYYIAHVNDDDGATLTQNFKMLYVCGILAG
jgi:hypothetical protein